MAVSSQPLPASSAPQRPDAPGLPAPDAWEYVRAVLGALGGLTAVASGLTVAGVVAHVAHLRMLGLPYFELPPAQYASIAFDLVTDSLWLAMSSKTSVGWCVILASCITVLSLLAAGIWHDRRSPTHRARTSAWAPVAPPAMMLFAVCVGASLVHRCGPALDVRDLLWWAPLKPATEAAPSSGATPNEPDAAQAGATASVAPRPSGAPADVQSMEIAVQLLARSQLGSKSCEERQAGSTARRWLRARYGENALTAMFLLVWVAIGWQVRKLVDTAQAGVSEWTTGFRIFRVVSEIATAFMLLAVLLVLPTNYGVMVLPTTYPVAMVDALGATSNPRLPGGAPGESTPQLGTGGVKEVAGPGDQGVSPGAQGPAYLLSYSERGGESVYFLRRAHDGSGWTLEEHRLKGSKQAPLCGLGDVLWDVRAPVSDATWHLWHLQGDQPGAESRAVGWVAALAGGWWVAAILVALAVTGSCVCRWFSDRHAEALCSLVRTIAARVRGRRPSRIVSEPPPVRPPAQAPPAHPGRFLTAILVRWGVVLVCVAVVAIILFPVFARAREKSRQASCLSNLKQIGLAVQMYAQDYDDVYPAAYNWADGLTPYIKYNGVFICPVARDRRQPSYAYNVSLDRQPTQTIAQAVKAPLAFDSRSGLNMSGGPELVEPRHDGGANFAFADGHAKWWRKEDSDQLLWGPPWTVGGGSVPKAAGEAGPTATSRPTPATP
jgi:prepilin-type processing-associated H-X9-DG protein